MDYEISAQVKVSLDNPWATSQYGFGGRPVREAGWKSDVLGARFYSAVEAKRKLMQCSVVVWGVEAAGRGVEAVLTDEHPVAVYGAPVVLVRGLPYSPADVLLHGWYIQLAGAKDTAATDIVTSWQRAMSRLYGRS